MNDVTRILQWSKRLQTCLKTEMEKSRKNLFYKSKVDPCAKEIFNKGM